MKAFGANRLPILAAEIHSLNADVRRHDEAAAKAAIDAGQALLEAKELCRHGEWTAWRRGTGLTERTAQRWMHLARSGLKSATVADLGGIREADLFMSWHRREGLSAWPVEQVARAIIEGRRLRELSPAELEREIDVFNETLAMFPEATR